LILTESVHLNIMYFLQKTFKKGFFIFFNVRDSVSDIEKACFLFFDTKNRKYSMIQNMFIITVCPLTRQKGIDTLTYFSASFFEKGSIISIPLRKKIIEGCVLEVKNIEKEKSAVRNASFVLHKIKKQKAHSLLPKEWCTSVKKTADFYAQSYSQTFFSLISPLLFEFYAEKKNENTKKEREKKNISFHSTLFQGFFLDRISLYRTLIREAFAQKSSLCFVLPHREALFHIIPFLEKDCCGHFYSLYSTMTQKKKKEVLEKIHSSPHPVIVFITPHYIFLPRKDFRHYIIENENNELYRTSHSPFIDFRFLIATLAKETKSTLLYADIPLSLSRIYEKKKGLSDEITTGSQKRFTLPVRASIIDRREEKRFSGTPFTCISKELENALSLYSEKKEKTLLIVNRRGLSTTTVCNDCGNTVLCKECDATVTLHKGVSENYFLCHSCGAFRSAKERCLYCNSWKLEALGIGIEKVSEEIKKKFPDIPLFIAVSDVYKNTKELKKILSLYENTTGALLISTLPSLRYIKEKIPFVGIVSLDTLFSLPVFNIQEKIAHILLSLAEKTEKEFFLQTRHSDIDFLITLLSGKIGSFYKEEMFLRKKFGYPPETVLIKISVETRRENMDSLLEEMGSLLTPHGALLSPHTRTTQKNTFIRFFFFRIEEEKWPDETLLSILRTLPPSVTITVNPSDVV
jgi:primosomal protein N' (replication factor Y) (superfamily II helicase)